METQPTFYRNLTETIFELVGHNYVVLSYFGAFVIALIFAIKKPTRTNLLIVIGLFFLVFNFEYEKHISEGLRAQTEESLTRGDTHQKVRSLTKVLFEFLLPVGSYFLGWTLLIFSFYQGIWKHKTVAEKSAKE